MTVYSTNSALTAFSLLVVIACCSVAGAVSADEAAKKKRDHIYSHDNAREACIPSRGLWWGCTAKYDKPELTDPGALEDVEPSATADALSKGTPEGATVSNDTNAPIEIRQPSESDAVADTSMPVLSPATPVEEYIKPGGLIAMPASVNQIVWVERGAGRVNILQRVDESEYRILKRIPLQNDIWAPLGIYHVARQQSGGDSDRGAYPIGYPNSWDKLNDQAGEDLWLYCPPEYVESTLDTNCIVADDTSRIIFDDYVDLANSLVVLSEGLGDSSAEESNGVVGALNAWVASWESLDSERYLSHYHRDFFNFENRLAGWSKNKKRINGRKTSIDVEVAELTALAYPGEEGLVSMRFYQVYNSSNFQWSGWKELLWRKDEQGQWKILFED